MTRTLLYCLCSVDPLAHVLRGFRESLLQQSASALMTASRATNVHRRCEDLSTDNGLVHFTINNFL